MVQTIITRGKAVVKDGGLRCNAVRAKEPNLTCNKLLAKANSQGQIAGHFRCDRCKNEVEVRTARS